MRSIAVNNYIKYCFHLPTCSARCHLHRHTLTPVRNVTHSQHITQWPRGLRLGSAAARLLGLRVRFPPEAWMSVCCERCVLSGRGLCDGPITRPENHTECGVSVCDRKPWIMRRPWPTEGCCAGGGDIYFLCNLKAPLLLLNLV